MKFQDAKWAFDDSINKSICSNMMRKCDEGVEEHQNYEAKILFNEGVDYYNNDQFEMAKRKFEQAEFKAVDMQIKLRASSMADRCRRLTL